MKHAEFSKLLCILKSETQSGILATSHLFRVWKRSCRTKSPLQDMIAISATARKSLLQGSTDNLSPLSWCDDVTNLQTVKDQASVDLVRVLVRRTLNVSTGEIMIMFSIC